MMSVQQAILLLICIALGNIAPSEGQCWYNSPGMSLLVIEDSPDDTVVPYGTWEGTPGDNITLTLDTTLSHYFYLDGETLKVLDGSLISRDLGDILQGRITCMQTHGPLYTHILTFIIEKINSLNPIVFDETAINPVKESLDVGEEVGRIAATDEDTNYISYEITSQIPDQAFSLESYAGAVDLILIKSLNYETYDSYTLIIVATSVGIDNLGQPFNQQAPIDITINILDVDDHDPRFKSCVPSSSFYLPPVYSANVGLQEDIWAEVHIEPCAIQAVDVDTGINSPISYSLIQPEGPKEHFVACEHQGNTTLQCPSGVITVDSAYYGRQSTTECPDIIYNQDVTDCVADGSEDVIKKLCNGQQSCEINPSNSVFGDPCEGTGKYVEVQYHCSGGGEYFAINYTSGEIYLRQPLPSLDPFMIYVVATEEEGVRSTTTAITVNPHCDIIPTSRKQKAVKYQKISDTSNVLPTTAQATTAAPPPTATVCNDVIIGQGVDLWLFYALSGVSLVLLIALLFMCCGKKASSKEGEVKAYWSPTKQDHFNDVCIKNETTTDS